MPGDHILGRRDARGSCLEARRGQQFAFGGVKMPWIMLKSTKTPGDRTWRRRDARDHVEGHRDARGSCFKLSRHQGITYEGAEVPGVTSRSDKGGGTGACALLGLFGIWSAGTALGGGGCGLGWGKWVLAVGGGGRGVCVFGNRCLSPKHQGAGAGACIHWFNKTPRGLVEGGIKKQCIIFKGHQGVRETRSGALRSC